MVMQTVVLLVFQGEKGTLARTCAHHLALQARAYLIMLLHNADWQTQHKLTRAQNQHLKGAAQLAVGAYAGHAFDVASTIVCAQHAGVQCSERMREPVCTAGADISLSYRRNPMRAFWSTRGLPSFKGMKC